MQYICHQDVTGDKVDAGLPSRKAGSDDKAVEARFSLPANTGAHAAEGSFGRYASNAPAKPF
jgi:hypothetical protein